MPLQRSWSACVCIGGIMIAFRSPSNGSPDLLRDQVTVVNKFRKWILKTKPICFKAVCFGAPYLGSGYARQSFVWFLFCRSGGFVCWTSWRLTALGRSMSTSVGRLPSIDSPSFLLSFSMFFEVVWAVLAVDLVCRERRTLLGLSNHKETAALIKSFSVCAP